MGRDERQEANSAVIEMHFYGFAVMFKKVIFFSFEKQ